MAVITLKREAICKDCGAELPVGSRARYYGRAGIYGLDCHESTAEDRQERRQRTRDRRGRASAEQARQERCADLGIPESDLHGEAWAQLDQREAEARDRDRAARGPTPQVAAPAGSGPLGLRDPGEDDADRWNEGQR